MAEAAVVEEVVMDLGLVGEIFVVVVDFDFELPSSRFACASLPLNFFVLGNGFELDRDMASPPLLTLSLCVSASSLELELSSALWSLILGGSGAGALASLSCRRLRQMFLLR